LEFFQRPREWIEAAVGRVSPTIRRDNKNTGKGFAEKLSVHRFGFVGRIWDSIGIVDASEIRRRR
jgi:hypothetical protein